MKTLLILIFVAISGLAVQAQTEKATLEGVIYFTNDTPRNLDEFPVELLTSDQKRTVAFTKPRHGGFILKDIEPGKYVLRIATAPKETCVLLYRVDFTEKLKITVRIVMDAACSRHNAAPREIPQ